MLVQQMVGDRLAIGIDFDAIANVRRAFARNRLFRGRRNAICLNKLDAQGKKRSGFLEPAKREGRPGDLCLG